MSDTMESDDIEIIEDEAKSQETDEADNQELQHPWPHLKEYFVLSPNQESTGAPKIISFQCVLCRPKDVIIKGQAASLYNLKSHIRRKHSARVFQFEESIKAGSSRGKRKMVLSSSISNNSSEPDSSETPVQKKRQTTIGDSFRQYSASSRVSQSHVDEKITDLFVCNMLPLHIVESPTFVSLVQTLNSTKTSMSRRTLGRRILTQHKTLEEHLIRYNYTSAFFKYRNSIR